MTENGCPDYRHFRLALVQMAPVVGDCTHNLVSIERWIERAAAQGAEMVCFPELSICGYSRVDVERLAEPVPGPSASHLVALARQYGIIVLAGLIETFDAAFYVSNLMASPDGLIQCYRKTHLGQREREVFCAGNDLPVFTATDRQGLTVNFAVGLCYDLHFPELAAAYALQGAQLLLAPHASPHAGVDRVRLWQRYMGARAYDNTMYVAACNHVQTLRTGGQSGGLAVWDYRTGEMLAHGTESGERLLLVDLDLSGVKHAREEGLPCYLRDRRAELYR